LFGSAPWTQPRPVDQLPVRVHLRDVETNRRRRRREGNPRPSGPGDFVATVEEIWRVEVVLLVPRGARCIRFSPTGSSWSRAS